MRIEQFVDLLHLEVKYRCITEISQNGGRPKIRMQWQSELFAKHGCLTMEVLKEKHNADGSNLVPVGTQNATRARKACRQLLIEQIRGQILFLPAGGGYRSIQAPQNLE